MCPLNQEPSHTSKPPRVVLQSEVPKTESQETEFASNTIFAFPPNRDTLGGTAYFIVRNEGNILIDSPAWESGNQDFLRLHGGVRYLFLTHRGAIGKTADVIQQTFDCEIVIQEQEAYLLPGLTLTTFTEEFTLDFTAKVIWTPGHSPGSSCLHYALDGGVLFSGRHILPNLQGEITPLRYSKTFHWKRQIKSIKSILEKFTPKTLQYICPGANTGFLRGKLLIDKAYDRLASLDLTALLRSGELE